MRSPRAKQQKGVGPLVADRFRESPEKFLVRRNTNQFRIERKFRGRLCKTRNGVVINPTSPGPIFFCQVRCGLNGRDFVMYKLRTMKADAAI